MADRGRRGDEQKVDIDRKTRHGRVLLRKGMHLHLELGCRTFISALSRLTKRGKRRLTTRNLPRQSDGLHDLVRVRCDRTLKRRVRIVPSSSRQSRTSLLKRENEQFLADVESFREQFDQSELDHDIGIGTRLSTNVSVQNRGEERAGGTNGDELVGGPGGVDGQVLPGLGRIREHAETVNRRGVSRFT